MKSLKVIVKFLFLMACIAEVSADPGDALVVPKAGSTKVDKISEISPEVATKLGIKVENGCVQDACGSCFVQNSRSGKKRAIYYDASGKEQSVEIR
jgi:hypothetical protein